MGLARYRRAALIAAALLAPLPAPAQPFTQAQRAEIVAIVRNALKTDPSILRDAIVALQKQQQQDAATASTDAITANWAAIYHTPTDQIAGNPNGRLTFVEFYDLRCPYCRKMQPDIEALLAQNPNIRLILKDLPVLGPASVLGAKAVIAAQPAGAYLKLQRTLMQNGVTIDPPTLAAAATAAGLPWPRLAPALNDPKIQSRIDANLTLARTLGIQGTPAFVIGNQLVSGAMTLEELRQALAGAGRGKACGDDRDKTNYLRIR